MQVNDLWTVYGDRDDQIIEAAEKILLRRLKHTKSDLMTDPESVKRFLRMHLAPREQEVFHVLFLDTRHRLIAAEDLFFGTIDGAEVHPREVVKAALKHNSAALILAHNHPSGSAEPSAADRAVTARLKQALHLIDVRLLDHFVVTGDQCTSLAARGWV